MGKVAADLKLKCDHCNKTFTRKYELKRHCTTKHQTNRLEPTCDHCCQAFKRKDILRKHMKTCRSLKRRKTESENAIPAKKVAVGPQLASCDVCNITGIKSFAVHSRTTKHKSNVLTKLDDFTDIIATAFAGRIISYRVRSPNKHIMVEEFLNEVKGRVVKQLSDIASIHEIKVFYELHAVFTQLKTQVKDEENDKSFSFHQKSVIITAADDVGPMYDELVQNIRTRLEMFEAAGSGWSMVEVQYLEVNINHYAALKGNSYIRTPKFIIKKHACRNVKNTDDACFAWAIMSALHPVKRNHDRTSSYPDYKTELNFEGITFPVAITSIERFESQNDISINVYSFEDKIISGPLFKTKGQRKRHINLLFLEEGQNTHYCWIRNMSALLAGQINLSERKNYLCDGCLLNFPSDDKLRKHLELGCENRRVRMPTTKNYISKFNNYHHTVKLPLVVYADFECLLKPIGNQDEHDKRKTIKTAIHEPYSFAYYIKCSYDDSKNVFRSFRGDDCAEKFIEMLDKDLLPYAKAVKSKKTLRMSEEDQANFNASQQCFMCHKNFGDQRKVRDHCHFTGNYRGAAHDDCNTKCKKSKEVPIIMHNSAKYDAHFIIRTLNPKRIYNIIPKNKEQFIAFNVISNGLKLKFIDSINFMASSLETLVSNLDKDQFRCLKQEFVEHKHLPLLMKKGVFPYEYLDHKGKLQDNSLPSRDKFYSTLNNCGISKKKYKRATEVWEKFQMNTLGDYSDLYLKTDVLLLADVFENFRDICLKIYELDPAHYMTAPGLSWDAMLKYTKVELELLTDYEMLQMVRKGIRGGLSQCSGKKSTANNEYLRNSNYNGKESVYIIYLDANNLYGWAMSQPLPLNDFRWLKEEEIAKLFIDIESLGDNTGKGYFLEVDLDYPEELHDKHNDLPFCPNHSLPGTVGAKDKKLIADLRAKTNYVIHHKNLQQALRNKLILKKIHRAVEFIESRWLEPYIALNTNHRSVAKNKFEKDFYKLMNNSVFGKTIENVEKYTTVKMVSEWESRGNRLGARALIGKPHFHSCKIINDHLITIQMNKSVVHYNKPSSVGCAVLDLAKTHMYEFHYDYMQKKFSNIKLLYTDTDSLLYEIRDDNFYKVIQTDLDERFDTSDYVEENFYGIRRVNGKVIGMFKDECNGVIITKFIGIRSKCYFISLDADETPDSDDDTDEEAPVIKKCIKKIAGIKQSTVKKDISEIDYEACLNDEPDKVITMCTIKNELHQLYSQTETKTALSNTDDKRFRIPGSTDTLAWGHKDINNYITIKQNIL